MTFHIRLKKRQKPETCFCSSIVVERNYLRQGLAFFFHRGKKVKIKKQPRKEALLYQVFVYRLQGGCNFIMQSDTGDSVIGCVTFCYNDNPGGIPSLICFIN